MIGSHSLGIFAGQRGEVESDPYWDNVTALLKWDGQVGASSVIDAKTGATWSREGTASVTDVQARFGDASMTCDSLGDSWYRDTDLLFSGEPYTVEAWVWFKGDGFTGSSLQDGRHGIITQSKNTAAGEFGINAIKPDSDFRLRFRFEGGNSGDGLATGVTPMSINTWYHIAATWDGTYQRGFVDGNLEWEIAKSFGWKPSGRFRLGRMYIFGSGNYERTLNGYLDEVRMTRNVARYTGPFTPPTAPFPSQ